MRQRVLLGDRSQPRARGGEKDPDLEVREEVGCSLSQWERLTPATPHDQVRRRWQANPTSAFGRGAATRGRHSRLLGDEWLDQDDAAIVEGCRRANARAWRALYRRYWETVYRWLVRLRIPRSERSDLRQDVFFSVYRSLAGFRGQCQLATWMFVITARRAAVARRRLQDQDRLSMLLGADEQECCPTDASDRMRVLIQLLGKLTPKKRAVFVMFELGELTMREVADALGCAGDTAWARLHHARTELVDIARKRGLPCQPWWCRRTQSNHEALP